MKPYENPTQSISHTAVHPVQRRIGPGLIAAFLTLAVLSGFLSQFVPSIRSFTMPRFGWVGLIACMNPLLFILPWLVKPSQRGLLAAAFVTLSLALINAIQLLLTGTRPVITNEFTERLHSSWLWSVLPLFVAGSYLLWSAKCGSPQQGSQENSEDAE